MPDPDQDPDTRNSNRASNETPCQNNCLMLVLALNTARWGEGYRGIRGGGWWLRCQMESSKQQA